MFPLIRKSLLTLATLASLAGAGLVTPAAAWDHRDRPARSWSDGRGGWGYERHHRPWGGEYRHHRPWGEYNRYGGWRRERCWIEMRRVWVDTRWGPQRRTVERRICR